MKRFRICCLFFLVFLPIKAKAAQPCVALTFDGGPNGKYTQQLLDGLYDRGIQVTFALQGSRIEEYPEILQRIIDDGHEIAVRGYSGQSLSGLSRRAIAQEIIQCQALLPQKLSVRFFCPPGECTDAVRQVAEARHLAILQGSIFPGHWPPGAVAAEIIRDGDVLCLHHNSQRTVEMAMQILDALMEENYQIIPVSQLAKERSVSIDPGISYRCFPP